MPKTIIGPKLVIDGELSGAEELIVFGAVNGTISASGQVWVGPGGRVCADINSASAQVAGQVEGQVSASDRVEITAQGNVTGDIRAPRIMIADGARFKGNVDMG